MKPDTFQISYWLWVRLVRQLRRRGGGKRESGAFLLARRGTSRIAKFICYDDLDPSALDTGIIVFHGAGFVPLWDYCRKKGMRVVADVHTHGDQWTGQSNADRTHPMVGQKGHLSLIMPYFAGRSLFSLRGVGVYEYLGNHEWMPHCDHKFNLSLF